LERRDIDIPRKALAHWVIQCGEHFQPLLNLMRDSLLSSRIIHCNEICVQFEKSLIENPAASLGYGYRPAAR
jgi:hypothetical protein